jgi:hypothetical protein
MGPFLRPSAERPVLVGRAIAAMIIQPGQKEGAFQRDLTSAWHLSMLLAIVHAASGECSKRPHQ